MKVFISWSGPRSNAMAVALKKWLPLILQYTKPWVSEKDISAGERWAQKIASELEASNFGIICVTPENINSEWILFEAGALSKSMQDSKVIPLLFDLELSELNGPLAQFQAIKADQVGILNIVKAINAVAENKATDNTIETLVPGMWPTFAASLAAIPDKAAAGKRSRPQGQILEDLVGQVRGLTAQMRHFDPEILEREPRYVPRRFREFDPHFLLEMVHNASIDRGIDYSLLLLAGVLQDRMPWLSEVLIDAHRELKTASHEQVQAINHSLQDIVRMATRGPLRDRFERSKADERLMMELPFLIDRAMSFRLDSWKVSESSDADKSETARGTHDLL